MVRKERNSSFELLRIVAMLLIVMHHYSVHGGFDYMGRLDMRLYFVQCLSMGGKVGVNLFVLISGFFLCTADFNWRRIIRLELEVIFYSVLIAIAFHFLRPGYGSLRQISKDLTPLQSERYWFYNSYFLLALLSPFLNKLVAALDKREFQKLLLLFSILWVVVPVVPKLRALQMTDQGWFLFLYLCAAYIRLFNGDFRHGKGLYIMLGAGGYVAILLSVAVVDVLSLKSLGLRKEFVYFLTMNSILVFPCSILLLIGFSKWDMGCRKAVNLLSSATFGVYLIHDNYLVRPFLWNEVFRNRSFLHSNRLFLHAAVAILAVYVACTLLDLVRQYAFEKPLCMLVDRVRIALDRGGTPAGSCEPVAGGDSASGGGLPTGHGGSSVTGDRR